TGVQIRQSRLRWPIPADLPGLILNQPLLDVQRRGKYLLLHFAPGTALIHLGMSGSLRIVDTNTAPGLHDHFDLVFGSVILRYCDPGRFGCLLWVDGAGEAGGEGALQNVVEQHPLLKHLGPEPLTDAFTADY